jgi:two-component system, OmpR family, response regulator VanR
MEHILAVDDDPQIQKLIRENLQVRGYAVQVASDGEKALDIFKAQEFDLLLLDLILPVISGIDVCLLIRQRSDVQIIVLSAR